MPGVGYPLFEFSQEESTWVIPPEYDDRTLLLKIPHFLVKGYRKIKLVKPDSFLPGRKLSWLLKILCRLMGQKQSFSATKHGSYSNDVPGELFLLVQWWHGFYSSNQPFLACSAKSNSYLVL